MLLSLEKSRKDSSLWSVPPRPPNTGKNSSPATRPPMKVLSSWGLPGRGKKRSRSWLRLLCRAKAKQRQPTSVFLPTSKPCARKRRHTTSTIWIKRSAFGFPIPSSSAPTIGRASVWSRGSSAILSWGLGWSRATGPRAKTRGPALPGTSGAMRCGARWRSLPLRISQTPALLWTFSSSISGKMEKSRTRSRRRQTLFRGSRTIRTRTPQQMPHRCSLSP